MSRDYLVSRAEAARILGVSDAAVGRIRAGNYPDGALTERYRLLVAVLQRAASKVETEQICASCPREECTGCRIAELD
ncbi:hypothetical protein [Hydrogenophilus thermoluteolus]|uniref:Helix-turn-helix domain-containing protein n=1 Tax=Hydrogenophilus thermoluteolus TaxID=297 RepID=A0A2Z6DY83_HYDTE|nr:hypothetical protein [Hydrogenophilus thermoluteolus]MBW7656230.1 hypothetical protein [Hydrogenophilus thermoluteolus]BBD77215.1 hypothetical protein HPTL_0948 [Hydrogenophilus thermoluteolus]